MKIEISARLIIVHEGKLFMVRHLKQSTGKPSDNWCTPGGRVELGEDIKAAARRESVEELGIEPDLGRLLYVHQFSWDGGETVDFMFLVNNPEDFLDIDLSKTTHGAQEIYQSGFIDPSDPGKIVLPPFLAEIDLDALPQQTQFYFYA